MPVGHIAKRRRFSPFPVKPAFWYRALPTIGDHMALQYLDDFHNEMIEVAKCAGKGSMRRMLPVYDLYCDIMTMSEYLDDVLKFMRLSQDNKYQTVRFRDDDDLLDRNFLYVTLRETTHRSLTRLLDIYNTIDQRVVDDAPIIQLHKDWKDFKKLNPYYVLDIAFGMPVKDASFINCEIAKILVDGLYMARRRNYLQRLHYEVSQLHDAGWYFVFDTMTLDGDHLDMFLEDANAIRDYTRNIGRKVNLALGRAKSASYTDVYKYFIVPEYGELNGRLHFHCLHCLRELPTGSFDPNIGRKVRNARLVPSLHGTWQFGFNQPVAVRYASDAFTVKRRWLHPTDKNGIPIRLKPIDAVINYIAKYVSKNTDSKKLNDNQRGEKKWQRMLKNKKKQNRLFRVRMSRGFGTNLPPMSHLSNTALTQMTQMHWSVCKITELLKRSAQKTLALRVGNLTLAQLKTVLPVQMNLLDSFRSLTQMNEASSAVNFTDMLMPVLKSEDICNELKEYLGSDKNIGFQSVPARFSERFGSK